MGTSRRLSRSRQRHKSLFSWEISAMCARSQQGSYHASAAFVVWTIAPNGAYLYLAVSHYYSSPVITLHRLSISASGDTARNKMVTVRRTIFLWTGLLALCTKAQIYNPSDYGCGTSQAIIQCYWDAPALPDNSTNITLGETYTLRWDTLLASTVDYFLQGADPTSLALFVTPSDGSVAGETLISGWL